MNPKEFRVSMKIERLNTDLASDKQLVNEVELARFGSVEEAMVYSYRLSCCSPVITGERELLAQLVDPKEFTPGD